METVAGESWRVAGSARAALLLVALAGFGLRLAFAVGTFGTHDVAYWQEFTQGALARGPIDIYGIDFSLNIYNHGPLTGWLLVALGHLADAGVSFPFLIRLPACLADLLTTVLIFDLVRRRRGERDALLAAAVFSLAPITVIVSGFHGNTDPVFVALALLSCWCLVARKAGLSAGVALGLAVSIKVVPVVLLPVLAVVAWRCGRSMLMRFMAGGGLVFLVLWVPVLLRQPSGFLHHVLGYSGTNNQWGIPQLVVVFSDLNSADTFAIGEHLKFVVVIAAAVLPTWLALRSRVEVPELLRFVALPTVMLLVLCSAFSMQYLVWPLALALVAAPLRLAVAYVVSASAFGLVVYCGWAGGFPWTWDETLFTSLPTIVLPIMFVTWFCLVRVGVALVVGDRDSRSAIDVVPAAVVPSGS